MRKIVLYFFHWFKSIYRFTFKSVSIIFGMHWHIIVEINLNSEEYQ
jgi:hypothetical protein